MEYKRLEHIENVLICVVESQLHDIDKVETKELGEVIDMIKDLEEALYYHTITKSMKGNEYDLAPYEVREGNSPKGRMEAKENKASQLEKYMQELSQDVVDMIEGASPEEKQMLEKKLTTLATKVGQMK